MSGLALVKPLAYVAFAAIVLGGIVVATMFLECSALGQC